MIEPLDAIKYIQTHALEYAKAKATRKYLEQFRKSQKAFLIADILKNADYPTGQAKDAYAYCHPTYVEKLEKLRTAIEIETNLEWMLESHKLKIEVWRSKGANNRAEINMNKNIT